MKALLAVDIGNTDAVLGWFEGPDLIQQWRIPGKNNWSADSLSNQILGLFSASGLSLSNVEGSVFSSVVPWFSRIFSESLQNLVGVTPLELHHDSHTGIHLDVDFPETLGQDRIANAIAAHHFFPQNLLVIDSGTATTLDLVTQEGIFTGGVICPGIQMLAQALSQQTAQLPLVSVEEPSEWIGKNTRECLQFGVFYGYFGMIESMVARICLNARRQNTPIEVVIATGGRCKLLVEQVSSIQQIQPDLTLQGLRLFYDLQKNS